MHFHTKVVLRRLPPNLTKEEFLAIVDPLPPHRYFRFCVPDHSLAPYETTTVFIDFTNADALFQFKERFDGYNFVDSKGNESVCIVEYAMYQKTPQPSIPSGGNDKRGTLASRKSYKEYLIKYEERKNAIENGESTVTTKNDNLNRTALERNLEQIKSREKEITDGKESKVSSLVQFMNDRYFRASTDNNRNRRFQGKERNAGAGGAGQTTAAAGDRSSVPSKKSAKGHGQSKSSKKGFKNIETTTTTSNANDTNPIPPTPSTASTAASSSTATTITTTTASTTKEISTVSSKNLQSTATSKETSKEATSTGAPNKVDSKPVEENKNTSTKNRNRGPKASRHNNYVDEYEAYYGEGANQDNFYEETTKSRGGRNRPYYRGGGGGGGGGRGGGRSYNAPVSQFWGLGPQEATPTPTTSNNKSNENDNNDLYVHPESGRNKGNQQYYNDEGGSYDDRDYGGYGGYGGGGGGSRLRDNSYIPRNKGGFRKSKTFRPSRGGSGGGGGGGNNAPSYSASRRG